MQLAGCKCYYSCQLFSCPAASGERIHDSQVMNSLSELKSTVSFLLKLFLAFFLQIHRDFRKPLVVMSPKNLLRHKSCKSNLSEFDDVQGHSGSDKQGTRFKRLIKDKNDHSDIEERIRRLVLCSGKVQFTDH